MLKQTIGQLLRQTAQNHATQSALISEDYQLNWAGVYQVVQAYVRYLRAEGVAPGMHVGIWSVNSGAYVLILLALCQMGAVAIPLNPSLTDSELLKLCQYADLHYFIHGEGFAQKELPLGLQTALWADNPAIHFVAMHDLRAATRPACEVSAVDCLSMEDNAALVHSARNPVSVFDDVDAVAVILSTSGTTGHMKGVMLSHNSLVNNSLAIAEGMRWTSKDRILVSVPFFHCFGLTACILASLHVGMSLVVMPRFRSVPCFSLIEQHRCTVLNGVPTMFLAMLNNAERQAYDLSSLRSGIIAGSLVSPRDYLRIVTMFGDDFHLQPSYGQTETSPACTLSAWDDSLEVKANSVGQVIPDVELRIVDEQGKTLDANEIGMIQVKGYNIMKGYYGMTKEFVELFSKDGWLTTGDLGCLTDEGRLQITGRKKSLIIRGGENIAPAEIEFALEQLPGVVSVHVVGVPDPVLQDEICACLILDDTITYTDEEIRSFLKDRLAPYKIPKYILRFAYFPTTTSGKIASRDLRKLAMKRLQIN